MNIEQKRQIAIIILALSLGVVAAVLTGNHIQESINKETARQSAEYENKKIKPLIREMDAMRKQIKELQLRPVAVAGQAAEPKKSAPALPKSSLALRTPAGKRAYTVRIDSLSAVGGLVNPGDFVDVIAHVDMPDPITGKKDKISTMVFQNVQILAVGTNLQSPGGYEQQQQQRALNITFALSPEESSLMSFIERNGKMQLILRAPAETDIEIIQVANWSTLADYVFEKQGTELIIPRAGGAIVQELPSEKEERAKPQIQIFNQGQSR